MRIRGYDEETEQVTEDTAVLTGEIANLTRTASNGFKGVTLFEDDGQTFRSTYDILDDIASIWDELSDRNQAQLLEKLGGKTRADVVASIISNFQTARDAMDTMVNSAGSAEREMENIQGSLEFKLNRLGQTWTGVAQNIFNTDISKGIVDGLTLVSSLVETVTDKLGTFGSLAIPGLIGAKIRTDKFKRPVDQVLYDLQGESFNPNSIDSVNSYATALGNLNSRQVSVATSTLGLNRQQSQAIKNYSNLVRFGEKYTINQWEQNTGLRVQGEEFEAVRQANGKMTKDMIDNAMRNKVAAQGLGDAVKDTADTIMRSEAEYGRVVAPLGGASQGLEQTGKGIKGFAKNTAKEFKAMFSSGLGMMNFAMMFGPVIVEAATRLYDVLAHAGEHALENAQEQLSEYQKINGEIDTLNQNYQDTGARIQELESLRREGGLTLTEQSELANLKAVNSETKLHIQQQRELARLQGERASSAYQEAWEKQTFQSISNAGSLQNHSRIAADIGTDVGKTVGYPEHVQDLINSYRELNEERQKGNGLEKDEEERYNNTRQTMLDTVEDIGGYISAMEEAGDTSSKAYKEAKTAYENLNWELNPIDFFDAKMAELPQSATSALEDLGMQGQVTAGDIGKLIQRFPEVRDWMQKAGIDTEKLVESFNALSRISTVTGQEMSTVEQALTGVTNQFGLANGALKNYQTAIEAGDQDSNFKQYAAAYKAFNEEYENGRKHSNTFWESAELILGRDRLEELQYNVESVKKAMNEYQSIFSDDSGMAKGALDYIKNRNDLLDETGQKLIDIKQDGENIDIQIDPTKIGELADKLGVAKGTLLSWMDAWRTFANIDYTNIESMTKAIDEAGMAIETAGGKAMSIDAIRAEMESAGMSGEQIYNSIEKLKGAGYVFVDLTQDASTLADTFTKLNVATKDDAGNLTVNYEALEGVLRSIGFSSEDVVTALNTLNGIDGITFEDSKGNIIELGTLIDQINSKTISPDIDFDVGNVTSKLHELLTLKQRLDTMDATGVNPSSDMYTSVQQQISEAQAYIEEHKGELEVELGVKVNPEDVVNGIMDGSIGSESDLASMFGLTPGEEGATIPSKFDDPDTTAIDEAIAEYEGKTVEIPTAFVDARGGGETSINTGKFSWKDFFTGPAIPDATTKISDAPIVQSILSKIRSAFSGGGGEKVEVPVTPKIEPADVTSAVTSATATSPVELPVSLDPTQIQTGLAQATETTPIKVPVEPDMTAFSTDTAGTGTTLTPIQVPVEPDFTGVSTDTAGVGTSLAPIKVPVEPDFTAFAAGVSGAGAGIAPIRVPVEPDPVAISSLSASIPTTAPPVMVPVNADPGPAISAISAIPASIGTITIPATVKVTGGAVNAAQQVDTTTVNVAVNYNPNTGSLPESFPDISRMVNYIAQLAALPSTLPPITRFVNYVPTGDHVNGTANASGTAHVNGTAYAKGNWGKAPGGTALVGELGREIVVDPRTGGWYTVGDGGAEFTNIPAGAIVFNHKQTEALFKYGKVAGRGRALASGTAMAGGSTDSFDNGRIPLSATAALDIELNVNDKDLEKKLEKELSEMSDKLEYILGQYEHKIFLIEKNAINGFTEEDTRNVISIYRKMMDEVHAQADAARAKGLTDNSATVRQLSEKWFELRDNMKEAIDDYYEGLISKTQNAIKLLDFQTGELQNKFHNRTELVYKQVDAISTATKEVSDELQKLGQGGNVDLLKRPVIDASILRDVGWDDAGDGKATVFSSTFSNEDGTKAINFTPIIVDENGHFVDALEPDTLERYAEEVIAGVHDDNLGLQIGAAFNGEDAIQQAELAAERVHELHEKYFLSPDKRTTSYWEFTDDGNYDAILKNLDEVIEKQREIQRIAHEGADEKRALGYEEDSDEIRKFKDDWESAADAIVEAITTAYDAITGDLENRITLTENWLDNAVKGIGNDGDANFDQVRKYSDDIYNYYTQMQTAIHEEAERLRALGYSDTSEEVSKLSDLWWDYEEKRKTAALDAWKEIVQTAKDATDEVAGMYDTLKQAAKEYSSMGGYLTLDTLEKLLEMEPKYMQMLKEENGLWVIDEENVKKATAAKMEDLAITNALAYVERLRLAITGQSNEKLEELLWATHETADATWQLVYAQLASLDLTDDQYDAALHNINVIRSMAHAAIEGIGKESDEYKKQLDEMKDGLDDLIKYVMDMLKHKIDEQVDSLEDMKDKYKDIVDKKKESLQLTKKENDYQKGVRNKLKDMVKLQAQIESLRLDTSREAMAKRAQLEQQLVDIQEDVAETQADHAQELTEKALDDNLKAYENEKDQEIESLKKSISSEEKLYRMAVNYIRDNWSTLYDELIAWNTEYGSVINDEIDEAWRNASAAVERYGGYLEAVKSVTQELKDITDSVSLTVGKVDDADYDAEARAVRSNTQPTSQNTQSGSASSYNTSGILNTISKMRENSDDWFDASQDDRENLQKENERMAREIQNELPSGYRVYKENGVWYYRGTVKDSSGRRDTKGLLYGLTESLLNKMFEIHHTGGFAGNDPTPKQNEVFALLEKGEAIFTKDQQSSLMRILDFSKAIAGKFDNIAMTGANILTGQLKELANSTMTPAYAGAANVTYDINVPVQIFPAQKMDENEIKSLTNKISDYTIKTINNDIGRRGIRGGTKRF